ncbi:lysoplasmalogenase [Nocardioides sp. Bht2]|uniref:lysoplasmalogenase n=1 Tax=Nocardioides sp. Bht2 TaxID=3392297 RepID=UPI0039B427D1
MQRTVAWAVLGVLSLSHLGFQLADLDLLSAITQILLMPAVAALLWTLTDAPRGRLVRLGLVALGFSWLGDTLPRFVDDGFLLMVGGFLVAQVIYAVAFWPYRSRATVARARWLVPAAAVVVIALLWVCRDAGWLLPAVAVYATALVAMALLADGVNPVAGVGALVFVVSDAMIGLGAFTDLDLPASGFWIMLTYITAQILITLGIAREAHAHADS